MRELERIDRISDKFHLLWQHFPDMRFYQFILFICECGVELGIYRKGQDTFFFEDTLNEQVLDKMIEKYIKN